MERLGALPLDTAHVEKVTKFLHAIRVEPIECGRRSVGPYVALDRRDQLIKGLVARKSLNHIGTWHRTAAFKPVEQGGETRL